MSGRVPCSATSTSRPGCRLDGDEVLLAYYPAGRTAALLELQLVIALDRIEGVGGLQHLERPADADLAGDAEAVDLVAELTDIEVGGGEPDALAQGRDHVAQGDAVRRRPPRQHPKDPGVRRGVERARARVEPQLLIADPEPALARDQAAVVGAAHGHDAAVVAAIENDPPVRETRLVGDLVVGVDRHVPD